MNSKNRNLISFALVGIAAYMFTDIIHEVIGHSVASLILGQKIILLTSVFFRSKPGSIIIDIAGPLSNIFFGVLIFFILKYKRDLKILTRLLLFLIMIYNFYWFSGTVLQSSWSKTGDWTYTVQQLNIGEYGKILLIIFGIVFYYFSIKLNKTQNDKINLIYTGIPLKQFIFYSYFAAAAAAIIAGLFFTPNRL